MATAALDFGTGEEEPMAVPPNRFWTFTEGRAMFELGAFYASRMVLSNLPIPTPAQHANTTSTANIPSNNMEP